MLGSFPLEKGPGGLRLGEAAANEDAGGRLAEPELVWSARAFDASQSEIDHLPSTIGQATVRRPSDGGRCPEPATILRVGGRGELLLRRGLRRRVPRLSLRVQRRRFRAARRRGRRQARARPSNELDDDETADLARADRRRPHQRRPQRPRPLPGPPLGAALARRGRVARLLAPQARLPRRLARPPRQGGPARGRVGRRDPRSSATATRAASAPCSSSLPCRPGTSSSSGVRPTQAPGPRSRTPTACPARRRARSARSAPPGRSAPAAAPPRRGVDGSSRSRNRARAGSRRARSASRPSARASTTACSMPRSAAKRPIWRWILATKSSCGPAVPGVQTLAHIARR